MLPSLQIAQPKANPANCRIVQPHDAENHTEPARLQPGGARVQN
jgi:hypothetical protein